MQYSKYYTLMADGTIKQINPFTDNEVWSVPGRAGKPEGNGAVLPLTPLKPTDWTAFCAFCQDRLFETPPEKARLLQNQEGAFVHIDRVRPSEMAGNMTDHAWLFRRVPNLFEIVTVDYWKQNYSYVLSPENLAWKEMYLADPVGLKHVHDILAYKLRATGISD